MDLWFESDFTQSFSFKLQELEVENGKMPKITQFTQFYPIFYPIQVARAGGWDPIYPILPNLLINLPNLPNLSHWSCKSWRLRTARCATTSRSCATPSPTRPARTTRSSRKWSVSRDFYRFCIMTFCEQGVQKGTRHIFFLAIVKIVWVRQGKVCRSMSL